MAFLITITCKCKTVNNYVWVRGIKFICDHCHKEINYLEAICDNRVKTSEGMLRKEVKRRGKR